MEPIIEINHLSKAFGHHVVLKDINAKFYQGEVVCIIGSSGSGKSTMLRCLNLLETPTSGDILFKNESIITKKIDINKLKIQEAEVDSLYWMSIDEINELIKEDKFRKSNIIPLEKVLEKTR